MHYIFKFDIMYLYEVCKIDSRCEMAVRNLGDECPIQQMLLFRLGCDYYGTAKKTGKK